MNWPDPPSYLRAVPPVGDKSVGSIVESTPVAHATGSDWIDFTALVLVCSTEPLKISNFIGTVCPPLIVFHKIGVVAVGMSTGWKKPFIVHAPMLSFTMPAVFL